MHLLNSPQVPALVMMPAVPIAPRKRLRVARTVTATHDLHLRIAAQFVQLAGRFESTVMLAKGRRCADGKSILGVLMLGASRGARIRLMATGRDAEHAIAALAKLFQSH